MSSFTELRVAEEVQSLRTIHQKIVKPSEQVSGGVSDGTTEHAWVSSKSTFILIELLMMVTWRKRKCFARVHILTQ